MSDETVEPSIEPGDRMGMACVACDMDGHDVSTVRIARGVQAVEVVTVRPGMITVRLADGSLYMARPGQLAPLHEVDA